MLASRTLSELESVCKEILALQLDTSPKVLVQPTDVTSEDSVKALFDLLSGKNIQIDVLVNNAGVYRSDSMMRILLSTLRTGYLGTKPPAMHLMAAEEWWKTWEVNIKGTYLPTHHLLKSVFLSNDIAPKPITVLCTGYGTSCCFPWESYR